MTDPRRDDTDTRLRADADALRAHTARGLRPLSATARALARAAQDPNHKGAEMTASKRWIPITVAAAVLAAAGAVVAATQTDLFSISVDPDGKTDEQVEGEIRDQLLGDGVADPDVDYERSGDQEKLEIEGSKGDRQFHIVRKRAGDTGGVIEVAPPQIDTEREPGMTDDELEAKIRAQLQALGLDGDIEVDGDDVKVRVEREAGCDGPGC